MSPSPDGSECPKPNPQVGPPPYKEIALILSVAVAVLAFYFWPVLFRSGDGPSAQDIADAKRQAYEDTLRDLSDRIVISIPKNCLKTRMAKEELEAAITKAMQNASDDKRDQKPETSPKKAATCDGGDDSKPPPNDKNWKYKWPCEVEFEKPIAPFGKPIYLQTINICEGGRDALALSGLVSAVAKACESVSTPQTYENCIVDKFREHFPKRLKDE